MSTLALIPAKKRSTGIPDKNVRDFKGQPLVKWAVGVGLATCDKTVVSTDSGEVEGIVGDLCEVLPRPAPLCTDWAPMLDVVRHALMFFDHDVIVLLQPTQPFRRPDHIKRAVSLLEETGADSIVSVVRVPEHYSPDYAMRMQGGELVPFNARSPSRRQDTEPAYSRDGTVYAIRRETIGLGSLYGDSCLPLVIPSSESVNLDTEEDWRRAEEMS